MSIQDIRRANLRRWTEQHGVPSKEKSYFSQLLGGASFGERAARRLEADYGMGIGLLDRAIDEDAPSTPVDKQISDELSPAARALIAAIENADRNGIEAEAFETLGGVLRLATKAAKRSGRINSSGSSQSIDELEGGQPTSSKHKNHAA
ncbi:hypothetical protein [Burkholderia vietnamiensis]|uniref:hypothetical protein n=1 Tax=Burkholderia vietnamiensis TaxID=60552 RepID=UPI00158DBDAE|nr:hypothetical protein [Burkholderia vietnamiensis]MCA8145444.1 hypothetical protein [Burkholderia vietnamiensis]